MNLSEIKELFIRSLDHEASTADIPRRLEEAGVSFDFKYGFSERVLDRIFTAGMIINREVDFVRNLNYIFYRIAFTGIAAIALLLVSIFFTEGSLSFNSFLGLSDTHVESIVCLLTGN
jgi:hypothetical protein